MSYNKTLHFMKSSSGAEQTSGALLILRNYLLIYLMGGNIYIVYI